MGDGVVDASWWLIFLPIWLIFGKIVVSISAAQAEANRIAKTMDVDKLPEDPAEMASPSEDDQLKLQLVMSQKVMSMSYCLKLVFLGVMAVVVADRIESGTFSVFFIFFPV